MSSIVPVILSGGSGTRLWPLSRSSYPKQFLALTSDQSLFQQTLTRLEGLPGVLPALIVCKDEHRFLIAEQAQAVGKSLSGILLEPAARNTGPAIALAALRVRDSGKDPLILVLPSDHVIADRAAFLATVRRAVPIAEAGYLVTFGIVPERPETGYGYIQAGEELPEGGQKVMRFVEKPDLATAQSYLQAGTYTWNSGMFLFRASKYLEELSANHPEMVKACQAALVKAKIDLDFCRIAAAEFAACPSESIDYAVMEKTQRAAVLPLHAGWNDVGAWPSVWQVVPQDEKGNACHGDVMLDEASNNYVYADNRLVCLLGVTDLTVIETPDVVLVAHHERAQDVKRIVDRLVKNNRTEATTHRQLYRPWGSFDSIYEGHRFKVKRITVRPGERLSLQMHYHRAEHWIVVSGTAKVRMGEIEKLIAENESIFIPIGGVHLLENPGKIPLELIEVQTGAYLGEDDIVRFQDRYGRAEEKPPVPESC